jgi:hypothetical protein
MLRQKTLSNFGIWAKNHETDILHEKDFEKFVCFVVLFFVIFVV